MGNSEPAPGNHHRLCEKLLNAFSVGRAVRRRFTFRQNQEDSDKGKFAGLGSEAEAAPTGKQVKEIVITDVEKSPQNREKTAPTPVSSVKDINYKVENYINRMKTKFKG